MTDFFKTMETGVDPRPLYIFVSYKKISWHYYPLSPSIHIQILQSDLNTFP